MRPLSKGREGSKVGKEAGEGVSMGVGEGFWDKFEARVFEVWGKIR